MQRKHLSTDEILPGSDVLGNGERALSAVRIEDLGAPGGRCALVAVFSDLEERAGSGGGCIGNLGHVDEDGAVVGTTDGGV